MKISKGLRRRLSVKNIPLVDGTSENVEFTAESNRKFYNKYGISQHLIPITDKMIKVDFSDIIGDSYHDDESDGYMKKDSPVYRISHIPLSKRSFMNNIHGILRYINYFINYFDDRDNELLMLYFHFNTMILSSKVSLTPQKLIVSIKTLFGEYSFREKVAAMVEYNTVGNQFTKVDKRYDQSIQLTESHLKAIMAISCIHKFIIPIVSQYCQVRKDELNAEGFNEQSLYELSYMSLLEMFDDIYDVELYNKLFYTATTRIRKTEKTDKIMWARREHEGITPISYSGALIRDLTDISQKLYFKKSAIVFIHVCFDKSIDNELKRKDRVDYVDMDMSTSENEDSAPSPFDSWLIKNPGNNEMTLIQSHVSIKSVIRTLASEIGIDFEKEKWKKEMKFYKENLPPLDSSQMGLINLYYAGHSNYYDSMSVISNDDIIKLIILMKHDLQRNNYCILPQLITGEINRLAAKRYIRKHILKLFMDNPGYEDLEEQYLDSGFDISRVIESIKVLIVSKIKVVDYSELNGSILNCMDELKIDELIQFFKAFC